MGELAGAILICLLATVPVALAAQGGASPDALRARTEQAIVAADWVGLDSVQNVLRQRLGQSGGVRDAWLTYDLAYVLHRRASALIIEEKAKDAKAMLVEAVTLAARARELGAGSHALALEGALSGQLAGAGGALAAMRLGPRAFRLLDEAVAAAPNDARVALLNGITRLNAPRPFGGGPEKGEPEFRRAIRLFATDSSRSPQPRWGRADAHIWLAIALDELGRTAESRAELLRALELAPGHRWAASLLDAAGRRR